MSYLDRCRSCDIGGHEKCDGTVAEIDQDGLNHYVCRCYHRSRELERQRIQGAETRVRKLMRELGIERTHELVKKP